LRPEPSASKGRAQLTFVIVAVTTATVTILMCYFQLCADKLSRASHSTAMLSHAAQDHRWQWRSFQIGGGSALWILFYGLIYWFVRYRMLVLQYRRGAQGD
jgi:transmembrane 9 superfamily protein 2/4